MNQPKANKKRSVLEIHGIKLEDDYEWLRDKQWPKVADKKILSYLEEENNYYNDYFLRKGGLEPELYNEISTRLLVDEDTVKIKKGKYSYFERIKSNEKYTQIVRVDDSRNEKIIFDENIEAENSPFFHLSSYEVFDPKDLIAFSIDFKGNELYRVQIRNSFTGQIIEGNVIGSYGSIVWDCKGDGFYYIKLSPEWRSNKVYYHKLSHPQSEDILIYEEKDKLFSVNIKDSADNNVVLISTASKDITEIRYIDKFDSPYENKILYTREEEASCYADYINNEFYICSNKTNNNFNFYRFKKDSKQVTTIFEGDEEKYLLGFHLYNNCLVLSLRVKIKPEFKVFNYELKNINDIKFEEETCEAKAVYGSQYDNGLMIAYSSLITPKKHILFDFKNSSVKGKVIHEQQIGGNYISSNYKCELIFAPSREEGIIIPVSIAYNKSKFTKNGKNPLLIWGYGAYGFYRDPAFDPSIISLLDRGYVYAHAHIRGGDDLGYEWYETAKFLNKKRTFNDFVDVIKFLIENKYVDRSKVGISGRSAGGMLIGYVLNNYPDLVKAAIMEVPFIDVLNTMLDETLPLTHLEYKEWGNPNEKKYFDYMLSYSPYENIKPQAYPAIYITSGLNDQRVGYWEPAKYIAKMRELNTGQNCVLFNTQTESGHFGGRNRISKAKSDAKKYTFLINELK